MGKKSKRKKVKAMKEPEANVMSRRSFLKKALTAAAVASGPAAVLVLGARERAKLKKKATTPVEDVFKPVGRPELPLAEAIKKYGRVAYTRNVAGAKKNIYIIAQEHRDETKKQGEQLSKQGAKVHGEIHFIMDELRARGVPVAVVERGQSAEGGREITVPRTGTEEEIKNFRYGMRSLTHKGDIGSISNTFHQQGVYAFEMREAFFPEDFHTTPFGRLGITGESMDRYGEARRVLEASLAKHGKVTEEAKAEAKGHVDEAFRLDYLRSLYGMEWLHTAPSVIKQTKSLPNEDALGIIGGGHAHEMVEALKSGLFDAHKANVHVIVPNSYIHKIDWSRELPVTFNMTAAAGGKQELVRFPVKTYRADFESLKKRMAKAGKLEIKDGDISEIRR